MSTRNSPARKEYLRNYSRLYVAKNRAAYFAGKQCVKCGSTENLQLDHVDPKTKDLRLKKGTNLWSWSPVRRETEIAKCQVLCYPCHRIKTTEELSSVVVHGSKTMYSKYVCRCDPCREFKSIENAKRYIRKDTVE
jgi:5-methylcytosine-specific restriction endonuclease McrA